MGDAESLEMSRSASLIARTRSARRRPRASSSRSMEELRRDAQRIQHLAAVSEDVVGVGTLNTLAGMASSAKLIQV